MQKSLIAFYKIGIIEISYCFVENTIILLYAVKKKLNKPERHFQIKTNAKLYLPKKLE